MNTILPLLEAFGINALFVWIIIHFLYFRKSHRRDFYFTFLLISIAIFFVMFFMIFMLDDLKGKTGIGIGIGLFGIFSIMRYRTDAMPVREMTYLFSIICLSVVNALCANPAGVSSFIWIPNAVMLLAIFLCEVVLLKGKESSKLIQYDRIALIKPEKRDELIADLKERTGLNITHVNVGSIDFLRDMAILRVFYLDGEQFDQINNAYKITRDEWESVE